MLLCGMDLSKVRNITNNYQDVRLIGLREWRHASEIEPRDHGGPYVITQMGFDPEDPKLVPYDFVLGKSGEWVPLRIFFGLPSEERRREFIFGTAAEVMSLMETLPSQVRVIRSGLELDSLKPDMHDDLNAAIVKGETKMPREVVGDSGQTGRLPV